MREHDAEDGDRANAIKAWVVRQRMEIIRSNLTPMHRQVVNLSESPLAEGMRG